jgi:hypothetical protein
MGIAMGLFPRLFGQKNTGSTIKVDGQEYRITKSVIDGQEYFVSKNKYSAANDTYYSLLSHIQDWQAKKQYEKMLECCEKSLPLLEKFVSNVKKEFGSFDISSIPAIEVGCRYWAALCDKDKLEKVRKILSSVKELKIGWFGFVEGSFEDANLSERIQKYLSENPGFHQNRLGKALNTSGRDTSRLVGTLTNLGIITREPSGKTYKLYISIKPEISSDARPGPLQVDYDDLLHEYEDRPFCQE